MSKRPLEKLLQKDMSRKEFLAFSAVAVASVFGITGLVRQLLAGAATPTASSESENGTVNSPATIVTDSGASGGKAIQFGSASSGTWPPATVPSPYVTRQYSDYPVVEYSTLAKNAPVGATFQTIMNSYFPATKSYLHLPAGTYTMQGFPKSQYSVYSPNCMGIWGEGRDSTRINLLGTGGSSGRAALDLSFIGVNPPWSVMRLGPDDGNPQPIHNWGWTLSAEDQVSAGGALQIFSGYQVFKSNGETWENIRLKGANYANYYSPPGETNEVGSYHGSNLYFHDVEIDGKNYAGQYRGGAIGMNSMQTLHYKNCYFHDSNASGVTFSTAGESGPLSTNILTEDCIIYKNANHTTSPAGLTFGGVNHEGIGGYVQHTRTKITFDLAAGIQQPHFSFATKQLYGASGSARITLTDIDYTNGPPLANGLLLVAIPTTYAGGTNAQKTSDLTVIKNGVILTPVPRGATGDPNRNFMLLNEYI